MEHFLKLGLSPSALQSIADLDYAEPTPIQRDAIPLILEGRDIMGLAQTGTGKTAAFGLPLVQLLLKKDERREPKHASALILAPTRELVNQIDDNLRVFTRKTPLKTCRVVGGSSINVQIRNLSRGADILVATPGRLLDLINRKAIFLNKASFLVLDEADQMLDMGFIHDLRKIAQHVAKPRQTMLFSATMPKQIAELSRAYLTDPVRIEVAAPGKAADKVTQSVHFLEQKDKLAKLHDCLIERGDDVSLVFARTKHGAEKLMKQLVASGFSAASIHGNKSQGQRERAIKAFRNGTIKVLVATDVAARGIDIPGVSHVYNFELPEVAENYVHRIGRTARAGRDGQAIAFCAPHETHLLREIEKLMGSKIAIASGEEVDAKTANAARPEKGGRSGKGGSGKTRRRSRAAKPAGARKGPPNTEPGANNPASPQKRRRKPQQKRRPTQAASSEASPRSKPVGRNDASQSPRPQSRRRKTTRDRAPKPAG